MVGEKGGKKHIVDEEPYDPQSIPMKKWSDYEQEMFEKGSQVSGSTGTYGQSVVSHNSGSIPVYASPFPPTYAASAVGAIPMAQPQGRPISMMPAAVPSADGMPSDAQIASQIKSILATANLMTITKKQVREDLSLFFGVDMTPKKDFINKVIEETLQGAK